MDQSQPTPNDNSSTQPADPMATPTAEPMAAPVMPTAEPTAAPVMPPTEPMVETPTVIPESPSMGVQNAPVEENGASEVPTPMSMAEAPADPMAPVTTAASEAGATPAGPANSGEESVEDSAL